MLKPLVPNPFKGIAEKQVPAKLKLIAVGEHVTSQFHCTLHV